MVRKQKIDTNYFDIRSLILKGKENVKTYKLPEMEVLIRPLTDLEFEQCEIAMLDEIKDPVTRKFAFESSPSRMSNIDEEPETNYNVNYSELVKASTAFLLNIAYTSMKDFTDPFNIEDLRKIQGIKELALEVQNISGYNEKVKAEIEDFR